MKFWPTLMSRFGGSSKAVSINDSTTQSSTRHGNTKSLPRLTPTFTVSCAILALVKLWLVRRDEVPCLGSPYDDIWYMQAAKDWYWLRSYNELPFGTPPYLRLPAYPLYLALVNLTGVPLRIANELLLLLAAFVFAWVLIKAGQSRLLAGLFFAAVTFNPVSIITNNLAFPDTLYAPILMFSLAGLILLLIKRHDPHRLWYALATGIALAVLWHIRQESTIILGFFSAYALLWFLNARGEPEWHRSKLRQFVVLVAAPLIVVLVVSVAVRTANYNRFGVFSGDAMFTSDFEAAAKALVRIKPHPPIRFVPVTREVRERAYAVSPSFSELRSYFEGENGRNWENAGASVGVQVPGEISVGHFWWGLNQATYFAGYNRSARQAGRFYRRIAAEINAACDDGRLECRYTMSAFIDPERQNYVPYLWRSFLRTCRMFITTKEPPRLQEYPNLPRGQRELTESITNRRTALRTDGSARTDWESTVQSRLWAVHGNLILVLTYASVCGLVLLLICYRRLDLKDPVFSIMTLLLAVVAVRAAMITFLNASAFAFDDTRYAFPVMHLYTCVLLMLIFTSLKVVLSRVSYNHNWPRIHWRDFLKKDRFNRRKRIGNTQLKTDKKAKPSKST